MMLRTPRYIFPFLWCLFACGQAGDSTQVPEDSVPAVRTPQPDTLSRIPAKDTIATGSPDRNDSIIVLDAAKNRDTLHAVIQKDDQQLQVRVPVTGTRQLSAQLKPEGRERNIRISQIEMPDGKTDGPFGLTMQYKTIKKGVYTLIIARSNMADGIVKGPVEILVQKD